MTLTLIIICLRAIFIEISLRLARSFDYQGQMSRSVYYHYALNVILVIILILHPLSYFYKKEYHRGRQG